METLIKVKSDWIRKGLESILSSSYEKVYSIKNKFFKGPLIKIENRVSLSPADPDFYLHVYKKEVYRP